MPSSPGSCPVAHEYHAGIVFAGYTEVRGARTPERTSDWRNGSSPASISGSRRSNVPPSSPRIRKRRVGAVTNTPQSPKGQGTIVPVGGSYKAFRPKFFRRAPRAAFDLQHPDRFEVVRGPRLEVEPLVEAGGEVHRFRFLAVGQDDRARARVEGGHVVHQLDPVGMSGESLDRRDVKANGHGRLAGSVHERRFGETALQPLSERSLGLVSNE